MKFALERWELPVSEGQSNNGDYLAPIVGELWAVRPFAVCPKLHVVFARHVRGEVGGNWIVCERDSLTAKVWRPKKPGHSLPRIGPQIERGGLSLRRLFVFRFDGHPRFVTLRQDGVGSWLNGLTREATPFQIDIEASQYFFDSASIYNLLLAQLDDAASPLGFAQRWPHLTYNEKIKLLNQDPTQFTELKQVMTWVLILDRDVWKKYSAPSWKLNRYAPEKSYIIDGRGAGYSPDLKADAPLVDRWSHFLSRKDWPYNRAPDLAYHLCRIEFETYAANRIEVRVQGPPTAHEQLEAALKLRDWLRINGAPSDIEALLAF